MHVSVSQRALFVYNFVLMYVLNWCCVYVLVCVCVRVSLFLGITAYICCESVCMSV